LVSDQTTERPEKSPALATVSLGPVVYPDNNEALLKICQGGWMPESALGVWLKGLRERSKLSLRDLAQRSGVDHAYIHRLETGAKEAPSDEVVNKLGAALSPTTRDAEVFRFLARHPNIDVNMLNFVRENANVTFAEFHMLTTVVNRGTRPDYATSLARIRRILQEDDDG
jgi:HTH-type transcriptional regulator, competence development regulator